MRYINRAGFLIAVVLCATTAAQGQQQSSSIDALLLRPEVVLGNRDKLELSDDQVKQIEASFKDAESESRAFHEDVDAARGRLAKLLSSDKVDERAALKQLDAVLAAEDKARRLHLKLMIRLRNTLTADQRTIANQLQRQSSPNADTEQRLKSKITRIEQEVQRQMEAGNKPSDVIGLMKKFPELMQAGKVQEAEALLNRVTKLLGLTQNAQRSQRPLNPKLITKLLRLHHQARQIQESGKDVAPIQKVMRQVEPLIQQGKQQEAERLIDELLPRSKEPAVSKPPANRDDQHSRLDPIKARLSKLSYDQVVADIDALKEPDVEWRKIAWKTCLLDGIQASREQQKPIMLWVFIDRPIDDERC